MALLTESSPRTFRRMSLLVMALVLAATCRIGMAQTLFPEVAPDPDLEPADVVGIQMRALGHNDSPRAGVGIEITFRFASPNNRAVTGPLPRFAGLFATEAYQPMLNHERLEIGEATIEQDVARVPVLVEFDGGRRAGYLFFLSRQTESPFEDCWMTDRVIRVAIPESGPTVL